ncbi:MAG: protoporphyrinogen/coproporphyrinogen oxidase [Sporichthyaceae bacterium]
MTSADLLVLGAGPAGLAAAWRAARAGRSVIVLEAAPRVGGMAASLEVAGFRVDVGSHRLHPATPPHLLADLRTLIGRDLQQRPRHGRLRVANSWVGFPLKPLELARALPPRLLAGLARDTATAPLRKPGDDSFADVLRAGLGPALYEELYAPYARKLWGLDGEQIDGEQARRRVTADTPWKVLGKMIRRNRAGAGHSGPGQGRIFYYPRHGFGQIVDALAQAATDAGADIRTGTLVDKVLPGKEPGVLLADETHLTARHVFSTIPLPRLAQLTLPVAPQELTKAARHLRFRAMTLAYVVHAGGRWTEYDAHYLPGAHTPITRISEPANYRRNPDDPTDRTVLCAEIPCSVDDEAYSASPERLGAIVAEAAEQTGLPPLNISSVEVLRLRTVYPIYEVGFAARLAPLDEWARGLDGVTTFGRLGLFAHDNTHHALAMAYDAVAALGPDGFDHAAWARARDRFDAHVVED